MSKEDIYNSIINKKSGVNPFLTIMNFKISFKTWIKFARQRLRHIEMLKANGEGDKSPSFKDFEYKDDSDDEKIEVEIEIENFFSCTSEEDSVADDKLTSQQTLGFRRKDAFSHGSRSNSNYGS